MIFAFRFGAAGGGGAGSGVAIFFGRGARFRGGGERGSDGLGASTGAGVWGGAGFGFATRGERAAIFPGSFAFVMQVSGSASRRDVGVQR